MSDSVKEEVEVESSGASLLSVKKEGHEVESQGSSLLPVKTDGSKDPPPRFDTQKNTVISTPEQCQRYKDDFKVRHSVSRRRLAQIDVDQTHITKFFIDRRRQRKQRKEEMKKFWGGIPRRKRLILKNHTAMTKQSSLIQVSPLGSHPDNFNKAPPGRPEQHPSTSESDLPVFEDIREESKEEEEDLPSSDDPERSNQQHQLLCGEAQNTNDQQHFRPELLTESGKTSYRGMKRSHDSEEEQLHLTTEVSQGPIGKLVKLSTVSRPSGTEKNTVISSPEQYQRYKDDFNSSESRRIPPRIELLRRSRKGNARSEKKLIIQVSPLSSHPDNVNKAPPDRPEQYPSTSETDLPVSEDIGEESKEEEEDLPSSDDPERSNQPHQLLCGEAQNTNDKQHFRPELLTESGKTSYRFRCPGPGVFLCESTGLVFVMVQEAELLYRTVQWDERLLRSADKVAAGLLFDIKCSENAAVCQLHLPHCEVMDAPLPKDLLSVVHITDDGMNFLEPLEITDTHVVVTVSHFSAFGIVRKLIKRLLDSNDIRPISGKVLLFLGQPNPKTKRQKLNVFLLPRNIHLDEVSAQQRYSENIQVPSKCELFEDQSYTLHCPQAIKIQPKRAKFNMEFGPNYDPTFEVRLPTTTEEVTLTVKDNGQLVVWEYDVDLTDSTRRTGQMNAPEEHYVPAEEKLSSVRSQFVKRVSGPVLNQLLDKLLDLDIINDEEMQSVKTQSTTQDKARKLIDTVPKKGTVASSVLIAALRKADPNLSSQLKLS